MLPGESPVAGAVARPWKSSHELLAATRPPILAGAWHRERPSGSVPARERRTPGRFRRSPPAMLEACEVLDGGCHDVGAVKADGRQAGPDRGVHDSGVAEPIAHARCDRVRRFGLSDRMMNVLGGPRGATRAAFPACEVSASIVEPLTLGECPAGLLELRAGNNDEGEPTIARHASELDRHHRAVRRSSRVKTGLRTSSDLRRACLRTGPCVRAAP